MVRLTLRNSIIYILIWTVCTESYVIKNPNFIDPVSKPTETFEVNNKWSTAAFKKLESDMKDRFQNHSKTLDKRFKMKKLFYLSSVNNAMPLF